MEQEKLCFEIENCVFHTEKWKPNHAKDHKILTWCLERFIQLVTVTSVTVPFWVLVHYLVFPRSPIYPCSFLPIACHPLLYFLIGAGYFWMVFSVVSNLTLIGILASIYVYIVYCVFHQEFLANCKTGYKSSPSLRQPGTLQVAYRGVEVLQKCVNLWIGPILVPFATQFSLSCNYMLITRMGKLDFPSLTLLLGWTGGCVTV